MITDEGEGEGGIDHGVRNVCAVCILTQLRGMVGMRA